MGRQGNVKANERQSQVHVSLHSTTTRRNIQLDSMALLLCSAIQQAVVELQRLCFLRSAVATSLGCIFLCIRKPTCLLLLPQPLSHLCWLQCGLFWSAYEAPHCMSLLGVLAPATACDGPLGIWQTLSCKLPTIKVGKQGSSLKVHASCIAVTCQEGQSQSQSCNISSPVAVIHCKIRSGLGSRGLKQRVQN